MDLLEFVEDFWCNLKPVEINGVRFTAPSDLDSQDRTFIRDILRNAYFQPTLFSRHLKSVYTYIIESSEGEDEDFFPYALLDLSTGEVSYRDVGVNSNDGELKRQKIIDSEYAHSNFAGFDIDEFLFNQELRSWKLNQLEYTACLNGSDYVLPIETQEFYLSPLTDEELKRLNQSIYFNQYIEMFQSERIKKEEFQKYTVAQGSTDEQYDYIAKNTRKITMIHHFNILERHKRIQSETLIFHDVQNRRHIVLGGGSVLFTDIDPNNIPNFMMKPNILSMLGAMSDAITGRCNVLGIDEDKDTICTKKIAEIYFDWGANKPVQNVSNFRSYHLSFNIDLPF